MDKPTNIMLVCYFNEKEHIDMKDKVVHAWHNIHRKERVKIGWGRNIMLPFNFIINGFRLELAN